MKWCVLLCLVQWVRWSSAYHILMIFPVASHSHNTLARGIVDALLQAGHRVTWATPYPPREIIAGLDIIDVSVTRPIIEDTDFADPKNSGLAFVRAISTNISRTTLDTLALREAVVKSQFDAVITEPFFSSLDCGYAAVLQIPWVVFMSVPIQPYLESQVDEVRHLATVPMLLNHTPFPMNFWRRAFNTLMHVVMTVERWVYNLTTKSLYESKFSPLAAARGVTLPQFHDAYYNISIVLLNSHPSLSPAKSLPPNVVEIGGFHIKGEIPPLPQDLQELLDSSPQGVVYFSMGSVLKSANFPAETKRELLQALGELPYTVLWKFEEQLEARPDNVHIRPWMPQASILSHPHTKLFMTHGGVLSMTEAVNYGVPLLMVPVYADQGTNAFYATQLGIARTVHFSQTMVSSLKAEWNEMLNNDSYSKKAKHLSKIFRNRPVEPRKLIAHYIELAIDSQGAYHLRSKSLLYAWYQRWMLDQLAALLLLLTLLYFAARKSFRICTNQLYGAQSDKFNKKKKSYLLFLNPKILSSYMMVSSATVYINSFTSHC